MKNCAEISQLNMKKSARLRSSCPFNVNFCYAKYGLLGEKPFAKYTLHISPYANIYNLSPQQLVPINSLRIIPKKIGKGVYRIFPSSNARESITLLELQFHIWVNEKYGRKAKRNAAKGKQLPFQSSSANKTHCVKNCQFSSTILLHQHSNASSSEKDEIAWYW